MLLGRRPIDNRPGGRTALRSGRARFALVELGDQESIDLFLREEDARRALEECLCDEPGWAPSLYIERVELDGRELSPN